MASNLAYLMANHPAGRLSQDAIASKAKVAQRTISNMLNPDSHSPKLESVDAVARSFGLEAWQLLLPTLIQDLESDTNFLRVYDAYLASTPAGRRHIQRVAEREAEYGKAGGGGSDDDPTLTLNTTRISRLLPEK